jgi:uncharacterized protein
MAVRLSSISGAWRHCRSLPCGSPDLHTEDRGIVGQCQNGCGLNSKSPQRISSAAAPSRSNASARFGPAVGAERIARGRLEGAWLQNRPRRVIGRAMDREDIIALLRENEVALRARGVTHAALFGSRARGDARADSDTDIMIEIDPEARIGVWDYVGIKNFIAGLFDGPVDVVKRKTLKPFVRSSVITDAIDAF